jgi:two-component system, OmpR family, copper resistance phosphate regulon response regulator CusR
MNILVIEDEIKVAAFIKKGLEEQGYNVTVAFDGQMGERLALKGDHNIILLDLVLPLLNGVELCKRIRRSNETIPILMLTALGTMEDKITGFDCGADDYLTKPFEFKELLARIKALTKRASGIQHKSGSIKIFDLELDQLKKTVKRGDKLINLTAKEFILLEYFMLNKGRVLSRPEIAENVWDLNFDSGTNVIDVYINILRKKIDKGFDSKLIHTRIGLGYILDEI